MSIEIRDKELPTSLRIERSKRKVECTLRFFSFKDHDHHILYVPELNLSAYGDDKQEAERGLELTLDQFSEDILNLSKKEMDAELAKYGFYPRRMAKKQFDYSGAFIDSSGVLKKFSLPEDTEVETKVLTV